MKKETSKGRTAKQKAELQALAALPDEEIDTDDIPEVDDWSGAKRGVFYRPVKQQITLRIDADLIDWFKRHHPKGEGYQTSINRALREYLTLLVLKSEDSCFNGSLMTLPSASIHRLSGGVCGEIYTIFSFYNLCCGLGCAARVFAM